MFTFLRSLWAIANNDYQGPAKLEVFGKDEHIGWVRTVNNRIDILTVEGEAIQIDVRARFRLTPITWQELCGQCNNTKVSRNHTIETLHSRIATQYDRIDEHGSRIDDLRKALIKARIDIQEATKAGAPVLRAPFVALDKLLDEVLEADERAEQNDALPF